MGTTTTIVGLVKPTDGGDADTWGATTTGLNENADILEVWVSPWSTQVTIAEADDLTYPMVLNMPYDGDIDTVWAKTDSGTCTVTVKIAGVALGGTANSATSTAGSQAHVSTNTFSAGDAITFTVSSNASAVNLQVQVIGTRTSAS